MKDIPGHLAGTEEFEFRPASDAPEGAVFSLCITDDCMSPYICPGQTVHIAAGEKLEDFETGIFYYKGKVLCRQCCEDITGTLHLLAADPARADANISIPPECRGECLCLGRVILDEALPPPAYY